MSFLITGDKGADLCQSSRKLRREMTSNLHCKFGPDRAIKILIACPENNCQPPTCNSALISYQVSIIMGLLRGWRKLLDKLGADWPAHSRRPISA